MLNFIITILVLIPIYFATVGFCMGILRQFGMLKSDTCVTVLTIVILVLIVGLVIIHKGGVGLAL